jgi:hypothetical protein
MDNTPTHRPPNGAQLPGPPPSGPPLPWQPGGQPAVPPQPYPPQPYPPAPAAGPSGPPYPPPPVSGLPLSNPPPVSGPPSRRRRWVPVVAAVVAARVVVTGGALAWQALRGDSDDGGAIRPADSTAAPGRSTEPSASGRPSASTSTPGDEFDGTAVDEDKWGIYSDTSSPNGSVWSRDAVRVEGGILRITGTGRNPSGSGNVAGGVCWCKAGGKRTSGVWTVRARFDAGAGYGPTLLLWPDSDKAADGFATFANLNDPARRSVRSLVMWGTAGQKAEANLAGDFTQWHTYKIEWRTGTLKMYVDEQVLFDSTKSTGTVVPTGSMHLVMQVVVGPKDGVGAPTAATPDKVTTEVDWVRYTP